MAGTKRQGVPAVTKPTVDIPLIPESKTPPPKPTPLPDEYEDKVLSDLLNASRKRTPREKNTASSETRLPTERNSHMNILNRTIAVIKENKTTIARRALIAVGAAAGMAITSQLVDRIGTKRTADEEAILVEGEAVQDFEIPIS